MNYKPLQHAIYKGMSGKNGALQLNLQRPHFYKEGTKLKDFTGQDALDENGYLLDKEGWKVREGAIFIEVAPTVGPNKYDWENKINFALSVTDIGKIVLFLSTGESVSIMHDPGAKTEKQGATRKYLNLSSPGGLLEKGCLLNLSQSTGEQKTQYMVPMTPDECLVIKQLLIAAIPATLNWN